MTTKNPVKKIDYTKVKEIEDLRKAKVSFENAYSKLEELVAMQENNSISLEDNINYYKLGKILASYCQEILNKARTEIERIDND